MLESKIRPVNMFNKYWTILTLVTSNWSDDKSTLPFQMSEDIPSVYGDIYLELHGYSYTHDQPS